jgi:hypothetical protein
VQLQYPTHTYVVVGVLLFVSIGWRGTITLTNAYPPNLLLFLNARTFNNSAIRDAFNNVYTMPHLRVSPFLIGAYVYVGF